MSYKKYGFIRTACVTPSLKVADCSYNAAKIIDGCREAYDAGADVIVFPELCVTGYTCQDLFLQKKLLESAVQSALFISKKTSGLDAFILIGLPLAVSSCIYNVALAMYKGQILGAIPKTFIPNYSEFYEKRWFTPYEKQSAPKNIFLSKSNPCVPFGTDLIFEDSNNSGFSISCEICEDVWVPNPPSVQACLNGAVVVANLSASNEIIGKEDYRRLLVRSHSAHCICAYLYSSAGRDESTQDLVFSGHSLICENGTLLKESELFKNGITICDVDIERLLQERRRTTTFAQCAANASSEYRHISFAFSEKRVSEKKNLLRYVDAHPFVPSSKDECFSRCLSVVNLQSEGLAKRLRHINCESAVIGLSGGLDSTLALLITCRAFDLCGISRKLIRCVTMPCFGTTDRTYTNACALANECGAALLEIDIKESVRLHMKDIGQSESVHDVTYENCQARERTQVLMDIANKTNGIVIGTGDLSELALGWCTYNGDHMSMYGVNSSIPKTLVRHLVDWFAVECLKNKNEKIHDILKDILDTPVSPELLPPEKGQIAQKTEELVGPYELHDFFLYYLLRFGFSPSKILYLADCSSLPYSHEFKLKWLRIFYKRFFSQQFKRSCMPDGAKVGTINLSPRGDWRMPSDASVAVWLTEIDSLK